jgi:predicted exporter
MAGLLARDGEQQLALVQLADIRDVDALQAFAARHSELELIDLKATADSLAASWRGQVLIAMAIGALLLSAMVWIALRSSRRALRVLAPVALSSLVVLALLHGFGVALTLFHLVALVLAAGLGLDYALFFERSALESAEDSGAAQRRTLHALLVCVGSTGGVFGLLATSSIPVLNALGATVALGVLVHFLLAALLAGSPSSSSHA